MNFKALIAAFLSIVALAGVAWYASSDSKPSIPASGNDRADSQTSPDTKSPQHLLLVAPAAQIQSLQLVKGERLFQVSRIKDAHPLLGPWIAETSIPAASPIKWPAIPLAIESALNSLSHVVGTPHNTASPSRLAGSLITADASARTRRVDLEPPGLGGSPIASIDGQTYHLTTDPTSVFEDATWMGFINPLLAPGFGRDVHIIRVQDNERELVLERRYRAWQVQLGKIGGPYTPPYAGDINACEALAKVLSELAFTHFDLAVQNTAPPSGPSAQITLSRRVSGTLSSESRDGSDPPTFHTASINLRGTLGIIGTALEGTSTLSLRNADGSTRTLGPLTGSLDPAILQQVSTDLWSFVSRQAIDVPAADVLRVTVATATYTRRLTTWSVARKAATSSQPAEASTVDTNLDTNIRRFLFALEFARAESVAAAPSQIPADAVKVSLESPLRREPIQLTMWVRPGQVTIIDGSRGLVYSDPSAVLALSLLMPR